MNNTDVAALYVDTKYGPYPSIEGVDCWGLDRDATLYTGPWPVVAHPPCGHWGRYHQKCKDDGTTGPRAVEQVRSFGGILEQPKDSKLFTYCGLPRPGDPCDRYGGRTIMVRQVDWGHKAEKPTWLYLVRCNPSPLPPSRPNPPPPPLYKSGRQPRGWCEVLSKVQRRLTPPAFALWLVQSVRGSA